MILKMNLILKEVSEKTGAKGTFTLLHLDNEPDLWEEQLSMVNLRSQKGLILEARYSRIRWHDDGIPQP